MFLIALKYEISGWGYDFRKRNVPGIGRQVFNFLNIKCQTDRVWSVLALMIELQGSVVVTAAHTKTVPLIVKGNQRRKDDVDVIKRNNVLYVEFRFRNIVTVRIHHRVLIIFKKQQLTFGKRMNDRKCYLFALGKTPFNYTVGINFTVNTDVESHAFGVSDSLVFGELIYKLR